MKKRMKIELSESQAIVSFYAGETLVVGALAKKDDDNPTANALYYAAVGADEQQQLIAQLKKRIDDLEKTRRSDSRTLHNQIIGMQAAVIDAEHHGAERGMLWIANGLEGPDLLPDESDPHYHDAQVYYDYHCHEAEMERREAQCSN